MIGIDLLQPSSEFEPGQEKKQTKIYIFGFTSSAVLAKKSRRSSMSVREDVAHLASPQLVLAYPWADRP